MNIDDTNLRQRARTVAGVMASGPQLFVIDDLLPPLGSVDGARAGAFVAEAAGNARLGCLDIGQAGPLTAEEAEAAGVPSAWAEALSGIGSALVSLLEVVGPMPGTGGAETPMLALAAHVTDAALERPVVLVADGIDRDPNGAWLHLLDLCILSAHRKSAPLGIVAVDAHTTDTTSLTQPWASVRWSRTKPQTWEQELIDSVNQIPVGETRQVFLTASLCGDCFPIHPVLDGLGVAWQGDAADDAIDAFDDLVVDEAELALDTDGAHPFAPLVAYRFASTDVRARAARCLISEADAEVIRERAGRLAQHLEDAGVTERDPRAAAVVADLWRAAEMPHRAEAFIAQRLWRRVLVGDPDFTSELVLRAAWHGREWAAGVMAQVGELPRLFGLERADAVRSLLDKLKSV